MPQLLVGVNTAINHIDTKAFLLVCTKVLALYILDLNDDPQNYLRLSIPYWSKLFEKNPHPRYMNGLQRKDNISPTLVYTPVISLETRMTFKMQYHIEGHLYTYQEP